MFLFDRATPAFLILLCIDSVRSAIVPQAGSVSNSTTTRTYPPGVVAVYNSKRPSTTPAPTSSREIPWTGSGGDYHITSVSDPGGTTTITIHSTRTTVELGNGVWQGAGDLDPKLTSHCGSLASAYYDASASETAVMLKTGTVFDQRFNTETVSTYYALTWLGVDPWKPPKECVLRCGINADKVEIYYWPTPAVKAANATIPAATPAGPVTALVNGQTFTSPSVYIAFSTLFAGACGYADYLIGCDKVGKTYSKVTLTFAESDLSTYGPNPTQINFANFNGAIKPQLVLPTELNNYDPAWKTCSLNDFGAFDPPSMLTAATALLPAPTGPVIPNHSAAPTIVPAPVPAQVPGKPTVTATAGMTMAPALQSPSAAKADPGKSKSLEGSHPTASPSKIPANVDPPSAVEPAEGDPNGPPGPIAAPSKAPAKADPAPAAVPARANPKPGKPGIFADPPISASARDPAPTPLPPAPIGNDPPAVVASPIDTYPPQVSHYPVTAVTPAATPKAGEPAPKRPKPGKPGDSGKPGKPDTVGDPGKPGKPDTMGDPGKPGKPDKTGNPGKTGKPGKPTGVAAPVSTFGGQVVTALPSNGIAVGGTTLLPGNTATISGTPVAVDPAGNVVIGTQTFPHPVPGRVKPTPHHPPAVVVGGTTIRPAATPIFTAAGQRFTVVPNGVAVGGKTLHPGDPAVTVKGTRISLNPAGVVVGTSTIPISAASPSAAVFTIGSQIITADPSRILVGGATLTPGGPGVTIAGTPVSLGPNGLVIGTSTIPLTTTAAGASTTRGLGDIIASVFSSGVVSTPGANATGTSVTPFLGAASAGPGVKGWAVAAAAVLGWLVAVF